MAIETLHTQALPFRGRVDHTPIETVLKALALVVQEQRESRGLTQDEMAERIGLHRTYISQLECGKRNPSIVTLMQLAVCFDVSLSGFLRWVDEKVQTLRQPATTWYDSLRA